MTLYRLVPIACALAAMCGCEERGDIEPAPDAKKPTDIVFGDAAVNTVSDVKVTVAADAWTGAADVRDEVTPMKVTIENDGNAPVNVTYPSMALISKDGDTFAALPPFEIEGEVDKFVAVEVAKFDPDWEYDGYHIVETYDPLFSDDYIVWEGTYVAEPDYYTTYYHYWDEVEMPTVEMLSKALPEGVVQPKGKVSGFVYFEEIDPDEERIRFEMHLRNAKDGRRLGTVHIPFTIEDLGVQPE